MDAGLHARLESIEQELYLPFSHDEEEKLYNHISSIMNPDDYFYSLLHDSSPVISNGVPSDGTADVGREKNKMLSNHRRADVSAPGDRRRRAMQMQTIARKRRRDIMIRKLSTLRDMLPKARKFESRAALLEDIIKYIQYLQKQLQVMGNDIWYQTPPNPFRYYNILQVSPSSSSSSSSSSSMGLRFALAQPIIHYTPQQMANIITCPFQANSFDTSDESKWR